MPSLISARPCLYSLYILKTAKRQFYCRYFSRMHREKGSGRALGLYPFFRDGLCFFYLFLLAFYFRILILYTTNFNSRINKDIIIICSVFLFISFKTQGNFSSNQDKFQMLELLQANASHFKQTHFVILSQPTQFLSAIFTPCLGD